MLQNCIRTILALVALAFLGVCDSGSQERAFQFEQFPAKVFKGRIKLPKGIRKEPTGEWRDESDKMVGDFAINFAGEYWLIAHSCGTGCRGYSLSNLRDGADVPEIEMFDTGEPMPVTKDGHPYLTILHTKPDSRLLIAEYLLNFDDPNKQGTCRQRYYILQAGKLRPISKTFPYCTEGSDR